MAQPENDPEDEEMIGYQPEENDFINFLIRHPEHFVDRYNYENLWLLAFGFVMTFICSILICVVVILPYSAPYPHPPIKLVLPRQTRTLRDYGNLKRFHGWVDVQEQGVSNDYARYVGPNNKYPFIWLSVALAGSIDQYTDPGLYEEQSGIVKRTLVKPRQIIRDIDKLGLPDQFRGWVDVQNQGVANDYAYYVGPTDDIPFSWLTVALAGSSQQRTSEGSYTEKYGVVQPTLGKIHYEQSIDTSFQYFYLAFRLFCQTFSNNDWHNPNFIQAHSQYFTEHIIVDNRSNKTFTSEMAGTQLLPENGWPVIVDLTTAQNSSSETLSVQY